MEKRKQLNGKCIAVDFDHTLCATDLTKSPRQERYETAPPIQKTIDIVNELYDEGYSIIIYTARGMLTYVNNVKEIEKAYRKISEEWLRKHNVKYDSLVFGKMYFDLLIDDKALNVDSLDKIKNYL